MRGNVCAEVLEVDFSMERNAFCRVQKRNFSLSDTHTHAHEGCPSTDWYKFFVTVSNTKPDSLFCARLEVEIQVRSESTALPCNFADEQKYT